MRETIGTGLFLIGLGGIIVCFVLSFTGATYSQSRPWAGFQERARTRKDGTTYRQSYWSKGPPATKAKLAVGPQRAMWLFLAMFIGGWIIAG